MSYKQIHREENEAVLQRRQLVCERIENIATQKVSEVPDPFADFFKKEASFLQLTEEVRKMEETGKLDGLSEAENAEFNRMLYADLLGEAYEKSYLNPAYAVQKLGSEYGAMLSFLASELRATIGCAYEGKMLHFTILEELFVEIYVLFTDEELPQAREVQKTLYWFFHDYSEIFSEEAVRSMVDPDEDFFTEIIMQSDLSNPAYLYRSGAYVGANELGLHTYLNTLPEADIQAMADTYTEGYRIGFEVTGKDLSKKKTVNIEYPLGFERVVRAAIQNFEKMGLKPTIYREADSSFRGFGNAKRGFYASSPNRQYEYDHKNDKALYLDKAFVERRLETLKCAYEKFADLAAGHAGPAVIETFGEANFDPTNKPEAASYTEKQNELNVHYASMAGTITNQYIKGEERSFTIIAYPVPEIGADFEALFAETVKLNTLDYTLYRDMQQKIIDVLDTGVKVHIKGSGKNRTDLTVSLKKLNNPNKETIFENCVADVNIPVGEVFTSPVLSGTTGILHVSQVYLNGLSYVDPVITFTDGMISDYSCNNFESEEENRRYLYENVLMQHETLPMGEFAIGTNTTAYRMAREYGIADKLPILIAEKTGPHFAVGDTCYSHEEDVATYNPDGKEIVARDNEVSALRKEDPKKAYFNCHTDITIPYDELEAITVIRADGSTADIIRDGKFVVAGTEPLNEPLA